jgi:hypothetical protein
LADAIGMSRQMIHFYDKGAYPIPDSVIVRISDFLALHRKAIEQNAMRDQATIDGLLRSMKKLPRRHR